MTRSSDVTKYAANRRDNTIDWPHLLVLVLLLVPTFVSSDPILIDSESVNQNQGNDIFIVIFSLESTYNAIIGSFDTGTEKVICIRKEEDAIAVRENASPEKPPEREKRENTEKEVNSEDIGGKQVCHKEAASDNVPPQKPDQPEKKENTATLGKVAQRAKDGVKGTLAASAVIESGILAFNLCWSYGQLKSGQIEDEEFREQVISDIGATGGSIAGTAAGAAIGTVIFPGVGTWVGSMVGGMVGSYYGSQAGEAMLQD